MGHANSSASRGLHLNVVIAFGYPADPQALGLPRVPVGDGLLRRLPIRALGEVNIMRSRMLHSVSYSSTLLLQVLMPNTASACSSALITITQEAA